MYNPQFLNRYAYALNNPIRYTDPTGHAVSCEAEEDCKEVRRTDKLTAEEALGEAFSKFGVKVSDGWSTKHKFAVLNAVQLVGSRFAEEIGGTAVEAFRAAYGLNDGDYLYFEWDENCWGCREDPAGCDAGTTTGDACESGFGFTNTENWIEFASMSNIEVPLRNINNVIHELGHAFNLRLGRGPENALAVRQDLLVNGAGFYGNPNNRTWEASSGINGTETFADQFLGWVYGKWGADPLGPVRAEFMTQMNGGNGWVAQAAALP